MELLLQTNHLDPKATEGSLSIDGVFNCYTLELPFTDGSVGTAIPAGRFQVLAQPSPHFLEMAQTDAYFKPYASRMPHIICPPRSLIMFHPGNFVEQLKGCVAVGKTRGDDFILSSRLAFTAFYSKILNDMLANNLWVTVNRSVQ